METTDIPEQTNNVTPMNKPGKFKLLIIALTVILVIEAVWAVGYIQSARKNKQTVIPANTNKTAFPKEKIATLTFDPVDIQAQVGKEYTVNITVDTNTRSVNGVDGVFSYNPEFLQVVDSDNKTAGIQVKNGTLFDSLLVNSVDPVKGRVVLTASRLSKEEPTVSGTGTLAVVSFTAKKEGKTTLEFITNQTTGSSSHITESITSNDILTNTNHATVQITK